MIPAGVLIPDFPVGSFFAGRIVWIINFMLVSWFGDKGLRK